MLYIKFKILTPERFIDFQELYKHMLEVRLPGFEFEDKMSKVNWERITQDEIDIFFNESPPETTRYKELFPIYANKFLEEYLQYDMDRGEIFEKDVLSILNYLEFGFEVDMDNLEKINENLGLVEFSTGNFPYGGMERFLMVLKAFDLTPLECYNGFTIYEFDWTSDFEHDAIDLPEKTKEYLKKLEN